MRNEPGIQDPFSLEQELHLSAAAAVQAAAELIDGMTTIFHAGNMEALLEHLARLMAAPRTAKEVME